MKKPQAVRSGVRVTYRCYLHGPDGIRALAPYGAWGAQNVTERVARYNPAPGHFSDNDIMTQNQWQDNLIADADGMRRILADSHRIAVLGIKPESRSGQPAHYVPRYLQRAGYEVIPVPVYYPEVDEILGAPVYREVAAIPGPIDLVNVFRRSNDIPPHVDDIIASAPSAVWFQAGIRNDEAAETLARAGIQVVQSRCIMSDHQRFGL